MENKETLSDKRKEALEECGGITSDDAETTSEVEYFAYLIQKQDKEFIKELKEIYANCDYDDFDRTFAIDNMMKLAGEKLTGKPINLGDKLI